MLVFRIFKMVVFIIRFRKKQKKFNDYFIDKFLSPFEKQYQSNINPGTFHRIKEYYGYAIPLTCGAFASIYGRELSSQERENAILAAIITPLIDDFTDKNKLSIKQLDYLVSFPSNYIPTNLEEAVVRNILDHLMTTVSSPDGTIKEFKRTLAAQHWSEKQLDQTLPEDEIFRITWEKGGASLLLLHYMIKEIPDGQMIGVINQLGGAIQLCNDIFDFYKDMQEGVKTLATCSEDFAKLETLCFAECVKFNKMASGLNHKKNNLSLFIPFFSMVLGSGMVAVNKLSKLQQKLGGDPLSIRRVERKELVCDMEKTSNILRSIRYSYKIIKSA